MPSPKKSPTKMNGKPLWRWWYKNCLVQQVYLVLSVIAGILLGAYTILLANLKIHQTGYNENDQLMKLFEKYKTTIILYLVLSFVISFVINNLILVQYCNLGMGGGKNVIYSLLLFFIVLPIINWIVSYILGMLMLRKLLEEAAFMNLIKV